MSLLVNGITLDDANLTPLSKKITYWQNKNIKVVVLGSKVFFERLHCDKEKTSLISIKNISSLKKGLAFTISAITRNIAFLFNSKIVPKVDTVYSVSSVLDLIILPFFLKTTGKVKKWNTVFDNTVPLVADGKIISGSLITRILAWIFFKISLLLLKKADTIFVVKSELKAYLVQNRFNPKKIIITGNGVEEDLIKNAIVRKKYSYDGLFIGRINEAKGIFDLLEVTRIVKKTYPNFQLAIVGVGDENILNKLNKKILELKLKKNIQFLGFKTGQEKYDIIKSCKVFLFLSQTESVPVAPLEAVCSGKITLVYKLDAYKMYKNNEVQIFDQGDTKSVANTLIKILKDKSTINYNGLKLAGKYSWDKIAHKELKYIS